MFVYTRLLCEEIYYWECLITLRALLFVAHGVGEHMGRYSELVEILVQNGILVFGHDQGKTYTLLQYNCLHVCNIVVVLIN